MYYTIFAFVVFLFFLHTLLISNAFAGTSAIQLSFKSNLADAEKFSNSDEINTLLIAKGKKTTPKKVSRPKPQKASKGKKAPKKKGKLSGGKSKKSNKAKKTSKNTNKPTSSVKNDRNPDSTKPSQTKNSQVSKSTKTRIKNLTKSLSKEKRKENGLSQKQVDKLRKIVEKAGGKIRNDGTSGVKGSSAGVPHVHIEGLGGRIKRRHIWTQEGVQ